MSTWHEGASESDFGRHPLLQGADTAVNLGGAKSWPSVLDERLPVLEYGRTWKQKGIECKSVADGISCVNDRQHGFKITKSSKELF